MLLNIAWESLRDRKGAVLMCVLSIFVSVSLLITVDNLRTQAKDSFGRTISGVDLIVGARTGQINLLLSSVFRLGSPSNNISWQSIEEIKQSPGVDWVIPISLGDSHKGFRVMGTTSDYFTHFQYGAKQALVFSKGEAFDTLFETVVGADVAESLGYQVGDEIVMSHGVGHTSFTHHEHSPFVISGILKSTGTPVDKTVHVSLSGLKAAHLSDDHVEQLKNEVSSNPKHKLDVEQVTAAFVGLKNRITALQLQRNINQYSDEALMAILPGIALAELWQLVGNVERILLLISILILISSLMGMATMLLTSIRERQREFAVLRAIGASPWAIFILIQCEALLISLLSSLLAIGFVWSILELGQQWLSEEYGLFIDNTIVSEQTIVLAAFVCLASALIACIPAINAYRKTLQQGLSSR